MGVTMYPGAPSPRIADTDPTTTPGQPDMSPQCDLWGMPMLAPEAAAS